MDNGAFLQAHQHFGLAVHVPVIAHDVLLVVLEVAHVRTAVDPPQDSTIQLQHLEDGVFAVVALLGEAVADFLQIVELQQNLHLSVAVHVSTAGIVGDEGRRNGCRMLGRNLQIAVVPRFGSRTLGLRDTTLHGLNGIAAGSATPCILVVGGRQVLSNLRAITIEVVRDVVILVGLDAPADKDATCCLYGHDATVEVINHSLCVGIQGDDTHQD